MNGDVWDELLTPEPTERTVGKYVEETGDEKLKSTLGFDRANGVIGSVAESTINDAKDDVEHKLNPFVAGGCVPEGDNELTCKFNLDVARGTGKTPAEGNATVKFNDAVLTIEDADQAKGDHVKAKERKHGIAIVSDSDFIFCEPKEGKVICDRFEKPKTAKTVEGKRVGNIMQLSKKMEGGILEGKGRLLDLKKKERFETDKIKFPENGEVIADKKRDIVTVNL